MAAMAKVSLELVDACHDHICQPHLQETCPYEYEILFTNGSVGRRSPSQHYMWTHIAAGVVVKDGIDDEMKDSWGRTIVPKKVKVT